MSRWYLIFDGGCSLCGHLAGAIQNAAGSRLQTIGIHDPEARILLDQARPGGWKHAPYLVAVTPGGTQAWSGMRGGVRLAALIGPARAIRLWSLHRRLQVVIPPRISASTRSGWQVGRVSAVGLAVTLLGLSLLLGRTEPTACSDAPPLCNEDVAASATSWSP